MTPRRRTAPPPDLPGFTFVESVGSGGFADVYLFEQHMPRRRVAIKVLHTDRLTEDSFTEFTTEANLMALLSTHPSIVTIYAAGEASDGRPYLVMEYAPKPTMQARLRQEPLSVPEALRVGIQVSAAVETAHRAGVMHRDIKPANILVTEYNRPALTDFGIASTSTSDMARGMSIPWSAPEMFDEVPYGGPEADTYSLGATVFTMLAGYAPYQGQGRLGSIELIDHIRRAPVPVLPRPDVPPSLQKALQTAMAKDPAARQATALAFARMLQKVEIELGLAVTPIDIIDDTVGRELEDGEADGLTRVRGILSIAPIQVEPARYSSDEEAAAAAVQAAEDAAVRSAAAPAADGLVVSPHLRAKGGVAPDENIARANKRSLRLVIGGIVAAVVIVAAASIAATFLRPDTPKPHASSTPQNVSINFVPSPQNLTGTIDGDNAIFTWENPDFMEGDTYMWHTFVVGGTATADQRTVEESVTVPLNGQEQVCISVSIRRAGQSGSDQPAQKCVGPS